MEPPSLPKVTYVYRRSLLGSELWAESENNPCSSGLSGARPPKAPRSPWYHDPAWQSPAQRKDPADLLWKEGLPRIVQRDFTWTEVRPLGRKVLLLLPSS